MGIFERVADRFLSAYEGASLSLRRKSRFFLWTLAVMGLIGILLSAVMFFTGAYVAAWSLVAYLGLSVVFFSLLCKGLYQISVSLFLYAVFAVMFVAVKFDAYRNVYESYVMATLGSFLLIVASVVAFKPRQIAMITFLIFTGILALYALDAYPLEGRIGPLALQSLGTAILIVLGSGGFALASFRAHGALTRKIEEQLRESEDRCRYLKEAIRTARESVYRVGILSGKPDVPPIRPGFPPPKPDGGEKKPFRGDEPAQERPG